MRRDENGGTDRRSVGRARQGVLSLTVALTALVVLFPISIASLAFTSPRPPLWTTIAMVLAFVALHAASLLAIRRPVAAFVGASALMLVLLLVPAMREASAVVHPSALAYLLCLAQVAIRRRAALSAIALAVGVLGAAGIAVLDPVLGGSGPEALPARAAVFVGLAATAVAAWTCGLLVRAGATRAEERTHERVRQAIGDERMRISGELHDVVAHSLTVMIAQAEVARMLLAERPDAAERALDVVVGTGRDALRGLRGIVVAEGGSPLDPLPASASLADLVSSLRSPSCDVVLVETGAPEEPSPRVALALHRVVREALTNAVRHTTAPVRIEVRVDRGDTVSVTVDDDGGAGPSGSDLGTGTGLVGLAERVRLAGGTFRAGPRKGRGWSVHAELPGEGA